MEKKKRRKYRVNFTWIFLIISCFLVGAFLYYFETNNDRENFRTTSSGYYQVKGIDLSHHNPYPNWQKLEEEDVSFVYLKATEGTDHEDRNFVFNYQEGKKTNIRIGAYHFYIFAVSGEEQAKHFISIANSQPGDMIPAIDVEHSQTNPHSKDKKYIEKVVKELKVLEKELYDYYGVHPLIYTNYNCYQLYIANDFPNNPLWIVDLDKEPSSDLKNWRLWQFSHKGRVGGLKGYTDLNYYRYTINEFSELLLP